MKQIMQAGRKNLSLGCTPIATSYLSDFRVSICFFVQCSICGTGSRGWHRQHNPNSPNSRLYVYFTPWPDAQQRDEEMHEGEE
jgi:hypothetical protein